MTRALVIFESMFGSTRRIAEAIGAALADRMDVEIRAVVGASAESVTTADLVVVGAPTMGHTLSNPSTRAAAAEEAAKPERQLILEHGKDQPGVREWLSQLPETTNKHAAAFDTRVDMAEFLTGHASRKIAKRMKKRGFTVLSEPRSFLVGKDYGLLPGQEDAARRWGLELAAQLTGSPKPHSIR